MEQRGFWCREALEARESNPYLVFPYSPDATPLDQAFADAWWRGWDRADAVSEPRVNGLARNWQSHYRGGPSTIREVATVSLTAPRIAPGEVSWGTVPQNAGDRVAWGRWCGVLVCFALVWILMSKLPSFGRVQQWVFVYGPIAFLVWITFVCIRSTTQHIHYVCATVNGVLVVATISTGLQKERTKEFSFRWEEVNDFAVHVVDRGEGNAYYSAPLSFGRTTSLKTPILILEGKDKWPLKQFVEAVNLVRRQAEGKVTFEA